ncbi:hypothetical protein GTY81_19990 [Streptomyces sp. SID8366]|uniref:hypothetical protein n=1 Tax=unclassified Streptomyces TaxID=2593676 RepID=UPI000DB9FB23|nr:hypothetical protein [Streptomyces sp. PsTaAH-130]MYU06115.1 hypothetical protein [Streptomyces sp. SID8366]MYU61688.1 hypothetical protein [Streptomyces sp. SID69]RAJ64186.1 hypothetical protein K376_01283 [Streptomyces sp. PsTaAH-130]
MSVAVLGSHRATGRTITEQFHAFDARNPHVYRALERMAGRRLIAEHPHLAPAFELRRRRAA